MRADAERMSTACSAPPRRRAHRRCRCANISACRMPTPIAPSSAAHRSRCMSRTPRRRWRRACATSRSSPTAARSARSAGAAPAAGIQPLRDAFRPFLPATAYAHGGEPAHARIRHDARTTCRGRGRGARMGAAEPRGMGEEAAHRRRCAERAADQRSVHRARLLPGHRWRRRHRHDVGGRRARIWEAAGLRAGQRAVDHPCLDLLDAGSDPYRRAPVRRRGLSRWRGCATSDIDVLALYDAFTINTILFLEDLGFCPKGEGGRFVRADASRRRANWR